MMSDRDQILWDHMNGREPFRMGKGLSSKSRWGRDDKSPPESKIALAASDEFAIVVKGMDEEAGITPAPILTARSLPIASEGTAILKAPKVISRIEREVYGFPAAPALPTSMASLRVGLEILTKEFKKTKDYGVVRERFCAISIALNELQLWAPKFRTQPKISPFAKKNPKNFSLHKDHLVIDAHWLWSRKFSMPYAVKYSRLLDSTQPFDFELAALYATENWSSEYRAEEHFSFPSQIQWQLCTTNAKAHHQRYQELMDGVRVEKKARTPPLIGPVKKAISTWAKSSPAISGQEQNYVDLWLANELLGDEGKLKDVAELAGLMAGTPPLEASTARKKLLGLNRRLLLSK